MPERHRSAPVWECSIIFSSAIPPWCKGTGIITDSGDFIGGDGVDFPVQETAAASAAENGSPAGLKYKTKPRSGTEIPHW